MFYCAAFFLVIAMVTSVFGFSGIAGPNAGTAQGLFFLFAAMTVVTLVMGMQKVMGMQRETISD